MKRRSELGESVSSQDLLVGALKRAPDTAKSSRLLRNAIEQVLLESPRVSRYEGDTWVSEEFFVVRELRITCDELMTRVESIADTLTKLST